MSKIYIAHIGEKTCNIKKNDRVEILSQERRPNGLIRFQFIVDNGNTGRIETLYANTFHLVFTEEGTEKPQQPEVRVVLAEAHRVRAGDKLFVTVDPQFTNYLAEIYASLEELGVEAHVFPLPRGAVQFFAIEQTINVRMDPEIARLPIAKPPKES